MGPFKCPECGVWWAGFEHRCRSVPTTGPVTIFPGAADDPPFRPGSSSVAPWCGICRVYHIPGAGACTGTWSGS
jgi:hypothetical protein